MIETEFLNEIEKSNFSNASDFLDEVIGISK